MITRSDKVRIALAPLHALVGALILYRVATDGEARIFPVIGLGCAWLAYGVYRIALIRRVLK
jgi:hypothetical protein